MNLTLTADFQRSYRSKKGNVTFVYQVGGTPDALAEYEDVQGEFYRESEEKFPLYFTTRFFGKKGTLIITPNKKVVPDMSKFDMASSLSEQYGGNLGQALANSAAAELMGAPPDVPVAPTNVEPVKEPAPMEAYTDEQDSEA